MAERVDEELGKLSFFALLKGCNKTKKTEHFCSAFVGVAGFEPATSWSQTRRDDRATLHPEFSLRGCKYTTKIEFSNTISVIYFAIIKTNVFE